MSSDNNRHYCVNGNTSKGMSIEAGDFRSFDAGHPKVLRFSVSVSPDDYSRISEFSFYERAAATYDHIDGGTGTNNFPEEFGLRVLKDGTEIFKVVQQATTQQWSKVAYDFSTNPEFEVNSNTTFTFELLSHRLAGNGGSLQLWELDDLMIRGCCVGNNFSASNRLFKFDARKQGQAVELDWVTNREFINNRYFVERSKDGIRFEPLLQQLSESESYQVRRYLNKDASPLLGDNYYRLVTLRKDGIAEVSDVKKITFESDPQQVSLFPNPTRNEVYVNLKAYSGEAATLSIFNTLGLELQRKSIVEIQEDAIKISTETLQEGLYFILIEVEGKRKQSLPFVVAKK